MIFKVFPTPSDLENLSRVSTEKCSEADSFDYRNVVVNKPWGYEYLWYQNDTVAAWMLHLKRGHSTSLHCHVRKRTSLIVIAGRAVCSTLDDRFRLSPLDSMVLEAGVFHSTQATSPEGAFVLEIETPVMKGDLVRLKDSFGRQGTGYEGVSEYSQDCSKYEYQPLQPAVPNPLCFKGINFHLLDKTSHSFEPSQISEKCLVVPTRQPLMRQGRIVADTAETIFAKHVESFRVGLPINIELLYIQQNSM